MVNSRNLWAATVALGALVALAALVMLAALYASFWVQDKALALSLERTAVLTFFVGAALGFGVGYVGTLASRATARESQAREVGE